MNAKTKSKIDPEFRLDAAEFDEGMRKAFGVSSENKKEPKKAEPRAPKPKLPKRK
jgi:hypothetical protein